MVRGTAAVCRLAAGGTPAGRTGGAGSTGTWIRTGDRGRGRLACERRPRHCTGEASSGVNLQDGCRSASLEPGMPAVRAWEVSRQWSWLLQRPCRPLRVR